MNPYQKYLGGEDHLHKQVIGYLGNQYPKAPFHHSPLESKRTMFQQFKLKYLGSTSGFPDLFIAARNEQYGGLFIELKMKYNKPTQAQAAWIKTLNENGYLAVVCYTFDEAKNVIDRYFKKQK